LFTFGPQITHRFKEDCSCKAGVESITFLNLLRKFKLDGSDTIFVKDKADKLVGSVALIRHESVKLYLRVDKRGITHQQGSVQCLARSIWASSHNDHGWLKTSRVNVASLISAV